MFVKYETFNRKRLGTAIVETANMFQTVVDVEKLEVLPKVI